jgi:hypothetical protein
MLPKRQPVSEIFGVTGDERGSFSFYCPDPGLWYSPELETVAWLEIQGTTLRIHDIISSKVPTLTEMLDHLPFAVDRVELLFSPDRLHVDACPVPYRHEGSHLMLRGPFPAETHHFMVPPTARC